MPNLISDHVEASYWADQIAANRPADIFGKFNTGVIWTEVSNSLQEQGIVLDPHKLTAAINVCGYPLLLNHDPGKPIGRVIAAKVFKAKDGKKFIGALFGYYDGAEHRGFSDFDFDFIVDLGAPNELPELSDTDWIGIAVDPREVDVAWVNGVTEDAPLQVKTQLLSHNTAEPIAELIRVTLPYMTLVWNPFITTIATKAGEDTYKAMQKWLGRLFRKFSEHKNPIIAMQASLRDCDVTFIVRGNDVDVLMMARAGLEAAASQALHLVQALRRQNAPLRALFYEFDSERKVWIPSYAELMDGRFITDNRMLIVAEKLPNGLSLGLGDFMDDE
jgi:hypothetical protein